MEVWIVTLVSSLLYFRLDVVLADIKMLLWLDILNLQVVIADDLSNKISPVFDRWSIRSPLRYLAFKETILTAPKIL